AAVVIGRRVAVAVVGRSIAVAALVVAVTGVAVLLGRAAADRVADHGAGHTTDRRAAGAVAVVGRNAGAQQGAGDAADDRAGRAVAVLAHAAVVVVAVGLRRGEARDGEAADRRRGDQSGAGDANGLHGPSPVSVRG